MFERVRCNMCGWEGEDSELVCLPYKLVCPKCRTDKYLMDIEKGE